MEPLSCIAGHWARRVAGKSSRRGTPASGEAGVAVAVAAAGTVARGVAAGAGAGNGARGGGCGRRLTSATHRGKGCEDQVVHRLRTQAPADHEQVPFFVPAFNPGAGEGTHRFTGYSSCERVSGEGCSPSRGYTAVDLFGFWARERIFFFLPRAGLNVSINPRFIFRPRSTNTLPPLIFLIPRRIFILSRISGEPLISRPPEILAAATSIKSSLDFFKAFVMPD